MKLSNVIEGLYSGELSSHGMFATSETGDPKKLIIATNQALTDIYTRFPILMKDLTVIQRSYVTHYVLDSKYAKTSGNQYWYIYDTAVAPYTNDLLKIMSVTNEIGDTIVMNSNDYCKVANTAAPNILEIPNPQDTNALFVSYQANHTKLSTVEDSVYIPVNFLPALYTLIAHKIYSGGTAVEHVNKAAECLNKFEMFCNQQREFGMTNEDMFNSCAAKFCKGGWA